MSRPGPYLDRFFAARGQLVLTHRFHHTRLNTLRTLSVRLCVSLYTLWDKNSDLKKKK